MIPAALAAPFASTYADRFPRARVMIVSDLLRVVVTAGMVALVAFDAPCWRCSWRPSLSGVIATAFEPAKAALLPDLADEPDDLVAANVASSSIDSVSVFVGPALGGVLVAATSVEAVLALTALTFLWSAALVARIRPVAGLRRRGGRTSRACCVRRPKASRPSRGCRRCG